MPTKGVDERPDAWFWRRLDKLSVDGSALDLAATLTVGEGQAPANAGLAYLALNRVTDDVVPTESAVHDSRQHTIEAGAQDVLSLRIASTKGLRLWVHYGEHSYYIVRTH